MSEKITVLYASMTGNARDCAENAARKLTKAGHPAIAIDLANYNVGDIANESIGLVNIST